MEGLPAFTSWSRWSERCACGSRSTTSTRLPFAASAAPRLQVVVVLPTPPFWFMTATVFIARPPLPRCGDGGIVSDGRRRRRPEPEIETSVVERLGAARFGIGRGRGSAAGRAARRPDLHQVVQNAIPHLD